VNWVYQQLDFVVSIFIPLPLLFMGYILRSFGGKDLTKIVLFVMKLREDFPGTEERLITLCIETVSLVLMSKIKVVSKNVCNSVSIAERCIAFIFCDRLLTGHFIVDEKSGFIQSEKGQELVGAYEAPWWHMRMSVSNEVCVHVCEGVCVCVCVKSVSGILEKFSRSVMIKIV